MGGTIADVGIGLEHLPLSHTITTADGIECRLEQLVATDEGSLTAFLWIEGDLAGIDRALEEDATVERARLVVDGESRLYRVEWIDRTDVLARFLLEEKGAVISAHGSGEGWRLRLLSPAREELSRTYDYCRSNGIEVEIHTLYDADEGRQGRFDLTDAQEETLTRALERGYYEIPRNVDMDALAEEFGVSHQALSERLRRAHGALVETALATGETSDDDRPTEARPEPVDPSTHSQI